MIRRRAHPYACDALSFSAGTTRAEARGPLATVIRVVWHMWRHHAQRGRAGQALIAGLLMTMLATWHMHWLGRRRSRAAARGAPSQSRPLQQSDDMFRSSRVTRRERLSQASFQILKIKLTVSSRLL